MNPIPGLAPSAVASNVIELSNVTKKYQGAERNSVDDVSFRIAKGSFVAMLGPNGAGKTTLIGMLTTGLFPTAGSIRIAGFDVTEDKVEIRRRLGIVPQKSCLDASLSVEEHLRMHGALYGTFPFRISFRAMPAAYRERVMELAKILDLESVLYTKVGKLSGGFQRRAEIARALLTSPEVLVMDEPSAALDPDSRTQLWTAVLQARARYGPTILVTTHYLSEAENVDRVLILSQGKVLVEATPGELRQRFSSASMVLDSDDRGALRADLDRLRLSYQGAGPFNVSLGTQKAHEVAQSLQARLNHMEVHAPTLEEAYTKLVASSLASEGT